MKHKVIFFDWFNTLSTPLYWGQWKDNGLSDKFDIIQSVLFDKDKIYVDWMKGKHTSEEVVEKVLDKVGMSREQLFQDLKESSIKLGYVNNSIPRKIFMLKKQGYKVVIATDNMDAFSMWTVPVLRLNELFDDILNSYHLGVLKKEVTEEKSLFFDEYLKKNKIKPNQSILIDDGLDNKIVESHGIDFFHIEKGRPEPAFDFLLKQ